MKKQLPVVMTVTEVAQALGVSLASAYQLVREEKIRSIRIGRRIVVPMKAFEEFLDGQPAA